MAKTAPPVIVVKKRGHHRHAHHGGAWKVAYADFVTAMMAFFLVMWLVNASPEVRSSVGAYFRDPGAFDSQGGRGVLPGETSGVIGSEPADVSTAEAALERAAEQLREALRSLPSFERLEDRIEIIVTAEGLRIELLETADQSFFEVGRAEPRPDTTELLQVIATELAKLPNPVAIEGHTDSRVFGAQAQYGNWELSTDRGNAARRIMETGGLRPHQIEAVRGFADTSLRYPDAPLDDRNRRISIVVRRTGPQQQAAAGGGVGGAIR